MTFIQLLLRDCIYYRKSFLALSAAVCLVCSILTGALLIGDSVRGTLYDNLNQNTAFVQTLVRFSIPIDTDIPGGVLHTSGFISPGIKTHLYGFQNSSDIQGRDAYFSHGLAKTLQLKEGDTFTVRVQTISAIKSEDLMGIPPKLKQLQFIYRGILPDKKADVNFENPQLQTNNLFVNHNFLVQALELEKNAVNEVWLPKKQDVFRPSDDVIWKLSQLYFDQWNDRPILKNKAFFLSEKIQKICPEANRGITNLAESFTDDSDELHYFFVGAFEGNIFPVEKDSAVLAEHLPLHFADKGTLTYFTSDSFRKIVRKTHLFSPITKKIDTDINSTLNPEIPGLTDAASCTQWEAGLPIDFDKVSQTDETYWKRYKSKPKLYLNFDQAQELFFPGKCTVMVFEPNADTVAIQKKIVEALCTDPQLYQSENITDVLQNNIKSGIHFAPLFLGLSFFIIISALLVLTMLLKLHLMDRITEQRILVQFTDCERKLVFFHIMEIIIVLLPGILTGLLLGTVFCRVQLRLLEHIWNGIILMNQLSFHAKGISFILAFVITFFFSAVIIGWSLRYVSFKDRFYFVAPRSIRSVFSLGTVSFFRYWGQYRLCMILLLLGFLGTLGVGAFGIKSRGENAFSYQYVAETYLPVIPSYREPFPSGGLAVRVKMAESTDCSNILRAEIPTVYGCDTTKLTGNTDFLTGNSAAVDFGALFWIMKKKKGDTIHYPQGNITLDRIMKASVFQRGILMDRSGFESLFPEVQGAQFFLIQDEQSVQIYKKFLEPYGLKLSTVDQFMAEAEIFQNRYLTIFLQLAVLGFILGIGSLVLLILRNLYARRNEITYLNELGFSSQKIFRIYLVENLWLYLLSAFISLVILGVIAILAQLNIPVLVMGWIALTGIGIILIYIVLKCFFRVH